MLLAIRGGSFPPTCRRPPLRESGITGLFKRLLRRPPDLHNRSVPRLSRLRRLASPWLSPPRPRRKRKRRQRRGKLQTPYPSFPYQPGNPLKRKKLKKTKKLAGSKSQGNDPPNEAQLFAMMRLTAAKHGWSVEDQARPFGPDALPSTPPTAPPPAPHTPAYPVPGMSHISRAPAALGAPPGRSLSPCQWGRLLPPPGSEAIQTLCRLSHPNQTGHLSPNRPPRTRTCGRLPQLPPPSLKRKPLRLSAILARRRKHPSSAT